MADSELPDLAARRALDWVEDGMAVGLGTGRAASAFVHELGDCLRERGWTVRAVATSRATEALARRVGIPLVELADVDEFDVTVDGADEVDPRGDVIKGLGGALLREKVIARMSRAWVLCIGDEKRVPRLGARGVLPIEVAPFAEPFVRRRLADLGLRPTVRASGPGPELTDNGNLLVEARFDALPDAPGALERALRDIPGVVEVGLFLGMKPIVLAQRGRQVEVCGG